jgi:large-conductance mechanosensitive channel
MFKEFKNSPCAERAGHGRRHHHWRGVRQIVNSFVQDVLMPPIRTVLGGRIFQPVHQPCRGQFTTLAGEGGGAATLNYGLFFNTIINF